MNFDDDIDDHITPDSQDDDHATHAGAWGNDEFAFSGADTFDADNTELIPEAESVFEQLRTSNVTPLNMFAGERLTGDGEQTGYAPDEPASPDELVSPDEFASPYELASPDEQGPTSQDSSQQFSDTTGEPQPADEGLLDAGAPLAPVPAYDARHASFAEYRETWTPDQFDGFGNPFESSAFHHYQGQEPTCAIMAQLSVLQNLSGINLSNEQAVNLATYAGWYHNGTQPQHAGSILEHFGVRTEQKYGATLADVTDALARGDRVIVNVNATEVRTPFRDVATNSPVNQSGPGHALWVTGIDPQPDGNWKVIVCDSAYPDGGIKAIDAADFLNAWHDHGNFMLTAHPGSNMKPFA